MSGVKGIIFHYSIRAVVILGIWGCRSLINHIRNKRARKRKHLIVLNPGSSYKAANPRWLLKYVTVPVEELEAFSCPLLDSFKEQVARNGFNIELGRSCRDDLFCLDDTVTYLNHGSYGAAFRLALQVQQWYQEQLEKQPVMFMEDVALPGLCKAVAEVAALVGARWQDVVPITNATTGVSTVLACAGLRRGDLVVMTNFTYPAVAHAVARATTAARGGYIQLVLEPEDVLDHDRLCAVYEEGLKAGRGRVRLVILDHIPSAVPVVLPVARLAAICKKAGARVLVDGAHTLGSVRNLNIPSLGVDYYVANLHKWCCTPKGAAILWAHERVQPSLKPLVTSHGFGLGYRAEFLWQGTNNSSTWLAVPTCLAILSAIGWDRVLDYNTQLVAEAAARLAARWGSRWTLGPLVISTAAATAGGDNNVTASAAASTATTTASITSSVHGTNNDQGRLASLGTSSLEDSDGSLTRGESTRNESGSAEGRMMNPPHSAEHNKVRVLEPSATTEISIESGSSGQGEAMKKPRQGEVENRRSTDPSYESCMASIDLPALRDYSTDGEGAAALHDLLRHEYKIEVPIIPWDNKLWVRISGQIYCELQDHMKLGNIIQDLRA